MDALFTVAFVALGLWLAIAQWAGMESFLAHEHDQAAALWVGGVLLPLAATSYFSWAAAGLALAVDVVITLVALWAKHQENKSARGEKVSLLFRLLTS